MKKNKLILMVMIIIGSSLAFIIFFILIFHKSFAVPLESGTKVASNTDLTYYIDVIYDGVDASAVASSDTATANVNSDYIYVEDKLPDGLTFKNFVTTSDGTRVEYNPEVLENTPVEKELGKDQIILYLSLGLVVVILEVRKRQRKILV